MSYKTLSLEYGTNFASALSLNDGLKFVAKSYNLSDAPEVDVQLSQNIDMHPSLLRTVLKERVFSITVRVAPLDDLWSDNYWTYLHELNAVLNSGPLQLVFNRINIGDMSVLCYAEKPVEHSDAPGDFDIQLVAPDPVYTALVSGTAPSGNTMSLPTDPPVVASFPYLGTAPAFPIIQLTPNSANFYEKYWRTVTFANISPHQLSYFPVCITMDTASLVTAGKMRSDCGDIRLETMGGAIKDIYVRNPNTSSTKIWTVLYSLAPGEIRTLRLLYGNLNLTLQPEQTNTRPMFDMPTSTNTSWYYPNSMPQNTQPQGRCMQWVPASFAGTNIAPITWNHPDFPPTYSGQVGAFGAQATFHGLGSGYAGVEFDCNLSISSVSFDYRLRTQGGKAPFVVRGLRWGDSWRDDYIDQTDASQRTYLTRAASSGATTVYVASSSGMSVGNTVGIQQDDNTYVARTITSITASGGDYAVAFSGGGLTTTSSIGNEVSRYYNGMPFATHTITYATGDWPRAIAIGLRVDQATLSLGQWYYGAADNVTINFLSSETPTVTLGAEQTVYNQIDGYVQNLLTGEVIKIHTLLNSVDTLTIDCDERTAVVTKPADSTLTSVCNYGAIFLPVVNGAWYLVGDTVYVLLNDGTYFQSTVTAATSTSVTIADGLPGPASIGNGVWDKYHSNNVLDALIIPTIGQYWLHVVPGQANNQISFNGTLINLHYTINFPARYY